MVAAMEAPPSRITTQTPADHVDVLTKRLDALPKLLPELRFKLGEQASDLRIVRSNPKLMNEEMN